MQQSGKPEPTDSLDDNFQDGLPVNPEVFLENLKDLPEEQKEQVVRTLMLASRQHVSSSTCCTILLANPSTLQSLTQSNPEKVADMLDVIVENDRATAKLKEAQSEATTEYAKGNTLAIKNESDGMKRGQMTFIVMLLLVALVTVWLLAKEQYGLAVTALGFLVAASFVGGLAKLFRGHTSLANEDNEET